jgi:O-antigen/teichoic acid export membrane protein
LITVFIALVAVLNKAGKLRFNWNLPFFIMIIKKSLPFASLVLLMSFYNRIDPVLIERLLPGKVGYEQAGVYSQAFRLLDAGQNFSYLFAVLLLPLFARMLTNNENVEHLVKLSYSLLVSGTLIVAVSMACYSKQIMLLMYNQMPNETLLHFTSRIDQSSTIFSLLMFSFVAISSNYIMGTLLTANNNMKLLNYVALGGVIINMGLNIYLIPIFQSVGSAYAGMFAQVFTAIVQLILAIRIFKFRINYSLIGRFLLLILLLTIAAYLLRYKPELDWKYGLLIMLTAGLGASFLLRLLNLGELAKILTSK